MWTPGGCETSDGTPSCNQAGSTSCKTLKVSQFARIRAPCARKSDSPIPPDLGAILPESSHGTKTLAQSVARRHAKKQASRGSNTLSGIRSQRSKRGQKPKEAAKLFFRVSATTRALGSGSDNQTPFGCVEKGLRPGVWALLGAIFSRFGGYLGIDGQTIW